MTAWLFIGALLGACAHVSPEEKARIADEAAIRHAAYGAFLGGTPDGNSDDDRRMVNCLGYGTTGKIAPDPTRGEVEDEPPEGLKAFASLPDLVAPASFCRPSGYWHPTPKYRGQPLRLGVRITVEYIERTDQDTAIASVGIWRMDLTSPYWIVSDAGGWELRLSRRGSDWIVEDSRASWAY
jgi:hypothetical protein